MRRFAVLLLCAVLFVSVLQQFASETRAEAADATRFNPGLIISDSLFYDPNAMNESQIQSFLDQKVGTCTNGQCLNVASFAFPGKARKTSASTGNLICDTVPAGTMTAAHLIFLVEQACGISARVILVTLQKEQGLVTSTAPSVSALAHAMGMACPDTAPCDTAFEGLSNQIYSGTAQLKTYKAAAFGKQPGWNYIQFNPNTACGGTNLYIQNYGTAALYNYTPYQPNGAALSNLYGAGDSCSAYGNRNFWRYFSDWFGDPTGFAVGSYFLDYYAAHKAALGDPTSQMTCGLRDSGCMQTFLNGVIFGSAHSFAASVSYSTLATWSNYGRETNVMGYPVADQICGDMLDNACRQQFQGGWIVDDPITSSTVLFNPEYEAWGWWGREYGPLGFPIASQACTPTLCWQQFQGGYLTRTPSGDREMVPNAAWAVWSDWGGINGPLGAPVGSPSVDPSAGNYTLAFNKGIVTVTAGSGALTSSTDPWVAAQIANPWLGTRLSGRICTLQNGNCYEQFDNGWIVASPAGTVGVPSPIVAIWQAYGREYGPLGYPNANPSADPRTGAYTYSFTGGTAAVAAGAATLTSSTDPLLGTQIASPWLGASVGAKTCTLQGGNCYQPYEGGWLVWVGKAVYSVPAAVLTVWGNYGREYGPLGFPSASASGDVSAGNYSQAFTGGLVTATAGGAAVLTSSTDPWLGTLLSNPWLGASTGAKNCTMEWGVCYQPFRGGWLLWLGGPVVAIPSAVVNLWQAYGREYGPLGFPAGGATADPTNGNYKLPFNGGMITVTGGVAAITASTDPWLNAQVTNVWLGASSGAKACGLVGGACSQVFAGGWLLSDSHGVFALPNVVVQAWGWYGKDAGPMGLPLSGPAVVPAQGDYTIGFDGGTITVTGGVLTSATIG